MKTDPLIFVLRKIATWRQKRRNARLLKAVRDFAFLNVIEDQCHSGKVFVDATSVKDPGVKIRWQIDWEINPVYPDSLVREWEASKVKPESNS